MKVIDDGVPLRSSLREKTVGVIGGSTRYSMECHGVGHVVNSYSRKVFEKVTGSAFLKIFVKLRVVGAIVGRRGIPSLVLHITCCGWILAMSLKQQGLLGIGFFLLFPLGSSESRDHCHKPEEVCGKSHRSSQNVGAQVA